MNKALFRHLPAVERIKQQICEQRPAWPERVAVSVGREVIAATREAISSGQLKDAVGTAHYIDAALAQRLNLLDRPSLRRVINATGVLVHTNAGRAPLSREALDAINDTAAGYCNLELNLRNGRRGSRHDHLRPLLRWTCDAEDGLVVNNNAAAVMLSLHALAKGRPVLVSRGELVEIGGSFRVPDVMSAAGVTLVEVGTTNRTWARDYANAAQQLLDAGTPPAAIMQIHRSNFRLQGFVATPSLADLSEVARAHDIPLIADLGSGAIADPQRYGMAAEPTVAETLAAGADVATFSGDKLLGGPQAGMAVGAKRWIERLRANPMARAVRVDSLTIAALAATLRDHLLGRAGRNIPVARAAAASLTQLRAMAETVANGLSELPRLDVAVAPCDATVGGGSQPGERLESVAVSLRADAVSAARLSDRLRAANPPVLCRVKDERVWLDMRSTLCTTHPGQPEDELLKVARAALLVEN